MTEPATSAGRGAWTLLGKRETSVALMLVATVIGVTIVNPGFVSASNIADMLSACAIWVIIGLGVSLVIVTGEIDISVGSLFGVLAALLGVLTSPSHQGLSVWVAVPLVILAGVVAGLLNGVLVTLVRVPSIIATLGTMTVLRGVAQAILGGEWIKDLPPSVRAMGTSSILGLTPDVWVAGIALIAAAWLGWRTPLGRRIYATGSNPEGAALAGIRVGRMKIAAFAISGLMTALATLVRAPQLSVIDPGEGAGWELVVVTAVVVGGVSVRGGIGSAWGVALAALLLGIVRTVLVFLKLGPNLVYWERAVHGIFILGAVVADHLGRRGAVSPHGRSASARDGASPRIPPWSILVLGIVALTIDSFWRQPGFLALDAQMTLIPQAAELALLVVPMTIIMVMGGIDLSIGSAMALASVAGGLAFEAGAPMWVAAGVSVIVGAICGSINGAFVSFGRIHPLIVTLATMSLFRGVAEGVSSARSISGFPDWLTALGSDRVAGVPVILAPGVLAGVLGLALMWRGVAGRNARAIGFNETAARFSGIAVDRLKLLTYTASGAAAGIAAVMFMARRNTAKADVGSGIELDVITAVVLGGTSVAGGRGTVVGSLLGVLLLHELKQYLGMVGYDDEKVQLAIGAALIASVVFSGLVERGAKRGSQ